ncbi:MAG: 50S ribosomal protein L24 [Phycisphaerae bacterium]|nr:50S ribosomal protein L24 [Phycisphaerae bacterium]
MARNIRKGDKVVVIAGDDKGKTGEVLRVDQKADKIVVQGVNRVYRHMRPSRRHPHGGRIQKEMPIHISNVLPVDPETSRPTRVGFRQGRDGAKERFARRSGASLGAVTKATK